MSDAAEIVFVVNQNGARRGVAGETVVAALGDGRELYIARGGTAAPLGSAVIRAEFARSHRLPSTETEPRDALGLLHLRPS